MPENLVKPSVPPGESDVHPDWHKKKFPTLQVAVFFGLVVLVGILFNLYIYANPAALAFVNAYENATASRWVTALFLTCTLWLSLQYPWFAKLNRLEGSPELSAWTAPLPRLFVIGLWVASALILSLLPKACQAPSFLFQVPSLGQELIEPGSSLAVDPQVYTLGVQVTNETWKQDQVECSFLVSGDIITGGSYQVKKQCLAMVPLNSNAGTAVLLASVNKENCSSTTTSTLFLQKEK